MSRFVDGLLYFASGEFLLENRPNGGTVIFLRALITASSAYLITLGIRERLAPGATWCLSAAAARAALYDTFTWFGAIFAASYAALYARFASQWTYLASLYNEIKAAELRMTRDAKAEDALLSW